MITEEACTPGVDLLELVAGHGKAIIIDAFQTASAKARLKLPQDIIFFGIEAKEAGSFGEEYTLELGAAVPERISAILKAPGNNRQVN